MPLFLVTLTRSVRVHSTAEVEIEATGDGEAIERAHEMDSAGDLAWDTDAETDPQGPEVIAAIIPHVEG